MYRDETDEDLRDEIFHLKKQLSNVSTENNLLKVKIRKLQNEIIRREKEMDTLLNPRQTSDIRKILNERSALFVLNLKEKNDELLDILREKDVIIRRLQNQLDVTKLYSHNGKCKCSEHSDFDSKIRQIQMKVPCSKNGNFKSSLLEEKKKKNKIISWTSGLQEAESTLIRDAYLIQEEDESSSSSKSKEPSTSDIKDQYRNLSRDHLLSIIENLKNNQRSPSSRQTSSRKSSPESDLERIELFCESPHEEIQQLHFHFLDMISEVDFLKSKIALLQNSQEKTETVLKKKHNNIDRLAQEIKNLKRPRPRAKSCKNRTNRCYSSTDLVTRVYSAKNYAENVKYERNNKEVKNQEKVVKIKGKNVVQKDKPQKKDAIIQVEKIDSPESNSECIYIEKGSISIKEKQTQNEEKKDYSKYEYEDEVFDECDEESVEAS